MVRMGMRLSGSIAAGILALCFIFTGPLKTMAEPSLSTKIGDAVSSVYNSAVGATFTITKINANLGEDTKQTTRKRARARRDRDSLDITFSDRCDFGELRRSLKFIPPVQIQWSSSTFRTDNVLALRGVFTPGQRYVLVLPPDFKSSNGKTYAKTVSSFTMPDRESDIAFLDSGSVIERNSKQMLHLQIMNVSEVKFEGLQIPPVLIPYALREIESNSFLADSEKIIRQAADLLKGALASDPEFRTLTGDIEKDGQLFFSQEPVNVYHQFSIPLGFRHNREQGALELVEVKSLRSGQTAETELRLLRITDIGLTYKLSDTELLIWATSLYSGKPLADVSLYAFTSLHEAVSLGRTDARGLLIIRNKVSRKHAALNQNGPLLTSKELALASINLVAAVSPNDRSYVNIEHDGTVKPEGIKQERLAQKPVGMLKGHVFTERGIYRPGETVFFKGTVREYKGGAIAPPKASTVSLRIVNSKNEEIYNKSFALSEFGTASDQFSLKTFYPLGTYTLSMTYGPGKDDTAVRSFEVQEFRQPRHFVEITYKRETKKDEDFINLDVKKELLNCTIAGKYYAGGPVKHGKVRWSIYHTKSDYSRQDYPGYSFGHPLDPRTDLIESGESMLDEKGQITVPIQVGKDILSGKYGIEVAASVVDFDGRASSDSSVYQGDPEYLVGISNHPANIKPGENQTLYAVVIDKKGNKVTKGNVVVQVMERGYTYIQKRNAEGYLYNEQQQVWRSQLSAELPIRDDRAVFDFDFTRGGEYLITFTYREPGGREYVSATKYSMPGYYDYEYEGSREQPKNYGRLSLYPEKPLYTAGETIKVFINPPREISTCLVTVEQGSLMEYFTYDLKPGQQFIELPVKDAYNPNVYISVLATVPRTSFPVYTAQFDKEAPTFLFGTVDVEVKGGQQKIKIAVNEEQKKLRSLPGAEMTLNIATTDAEGKPVASEVAVAVVDESILSMTGFETPTLDILGKFLLPLGVFTGDLRLDLLKQTPYGLFRNAPLTGGDGEEGPAPEAVSSKIRKDFNPVAYFNPSVRTDAGGRASVTFKFPDTMTTYRVYAVACDKGSRYGTYQRPALVVKDFYMEPGLPAFFTRGDRFKFTVSAFNKTDKSGSLDFEVTPDEILSLASPRGRFSLGAMDRTLIPVDGTAQKAGITQLRFAGTFREYSDIVEMKVPVNSGHVRGTDTLYGNFQKMADVQYTLPKAVRDLRWEDVGPDEVRFVVTVSGSPFMRMSQGLRYFLHYPYG